MLEPIVGIYNPEIFNASTIAEAKKIILTDDGLPTEERWEREAPYLMTLFAKHITLDADSLVIDYGCGIGRMAKALIAEYKCRVVGVDISASMRALAASYVSSEKFFACDPEWLSFFTSWAPTAALSIWTLQHCLMPEYDIGWLYRVLVPGSRLFVVNNNQRVVPIVGNVWVDDRKDIGRLLEEKFSLVEIGRMDAAVVSKDLAAATFWGTYER